jgi:endogenous inhibitor of DNA gyrase (YacG/DUF329 family)
MEELADVQIDRGLCPRCSAPVPRRRTGRPATWCSQPCRRAAYEERRAAARGAIAVHVVDRVTTQTVEKEHGIKDCVGRVLASPVACTMLLEQLLAHLMDERALWDPKWARTVGVAVRLGSALGSMRSADLTW